MGSRPFEFSDKTKAEAWQRCEGRCERCGTMIKPSEAIYDHVVPGALGGRSAMTNCQVLGSRCCNPQKTFREDIPRIKKAQRNALRSAGFKIKGRGGGKRQQTPCAGIGALQRGWEIR